MIPALATLPSICNAEFSITTVEVVLKKFRGSKFRTSSFSNIDPVPFCVAVARAPDGSVAVRRSQDPDSAESLEFSRGEWSAFVEGVKAGEFDV